MRSPLAPLAGSGVANGTDDKPTLLLDDAIATAAEACNRVTAMSGWLCQKADAVFGPRPPAPGTPATEHAAVAAGGRVEVLRSTMQSLHHALSVLDSEADRFGPL
jgi:hypothetical protein